MAAVRWYPAKGIEKARWRPLKAADSKLLFPVNDPSATFSVLDDQHIEMRSTGVSLLRLGQPLLGTFSFDVSLDPQKSEGSGVFFRGQRVEQSITFQTLEFGHESSSNGQEPRLLWSRWSADLSNNDPGDSPPAARELLASVAIESASEPSLHQLQINCGQRAMPEVHWNGVPLPHAKWKLSAAGQAVQATPFAQLPTAFLGNLGLMNLGGSCVFEEPRLAYQ